MIDDILCSYIDNNIEQICINQERNRDENDEPFKMSYQFLKELLVSKNNKYNRDSLRLSLFFIAWTKLFYFNQ